MRIIYLLGLIAGILFTSFALQSVFDAVKIPIDLMAASGAGQIINYAIVLTLAWMFTTLVWRQSVVGFFLLYAQNWRKALGGFWFCAGLTFTVGLLWFLFVFTAGGARWSSAAWAQTDAHVLLKLFATGLVAIVLATTEEILFRSLAFKYLLTSTATVAVLRAMVVSAIIFALAHRFDDPLSWLEIKWAGLLIGLMLLGCLFALVYYLTNSLACSIGAHTGLIWISLAKKTQLIQVAHSGWDITNSFDPRTGPAAWILFIFLGALFWSLRHWLRKMFEIENLDLVAAAASQAKVDGAAPPAFGRSARRREWLVAILGGTACVLSFIVIQNLIDNKMTLNAKTSHAAADEFKAAVARGVSIRDAASAAGFQPADYIRSNFDEFRRHANGRVEIVGSTADLPGDGSPLVIFFVAGNNQIVFQGQTAGSASDNFARKFMLTDAAARNVRFSGMLSCQAGESLLFVELTSAMTYGIWPRTCP